MSQLTTLEPKDPNAVVDYQINWAPWLDGDTIASSTWVVEAGITKVSDTFTNTTTTIWLSGGTTGPYRLTNRIVTTNVTPRTQDRTITIRMREL
jgi:hypothetical protein